MNAQGACEHPSGIKSAHRWNRNPHAVVLASSIWTELSLRDQLQVCAHAPKHECDPCFFVVGCGAVTVQGFSGWCVCIFNPTRSLSSLFHSVAPRPAAPCCRNPLDTCAGASQFYFILFFCMFASAVFGLHTCGVRFEIILDCSLFSKTWIQTRFWEPHPA